MPAASLKQESTASRSPLIERETPATRSTRHDTGDVPMSVDRAFDGVEKADALLIVGTSLMVYSGCRFAEAAAAAGKPITAINLGRTRADHLLALKISQPSDEALAWTCKS